MEKKSIAVISAVLLVALVAAYAVLNQPIEPPTQPQQTPTTKPTPSPSPTAPTDSSITVIGWGDRHSLYPSKATVTSPQNRSYQTSSLTLKLNVTTASWVLNSVYYQADWIDSSYHRLYYVGNSQVSGEYARAITIEANFTNIPTGSHIVNIVANYHDGSHAYDSVGFTIDNVHS